jgi:hypothetical protein
VISVVEGVTLPSGFIVNGGESAASTLWSWFTEATIPTRRKAKTKMLS